MWQLLIVVLFALLGIGQMNPPVYYAKIIKLDGTVVAAPLEAGQIEFSSTCYVHGSRNQGRVTIPLKQPTGQDAWLHDIYDLLDYEQRIEIYDNKDLTGDPVWTGVITELPADLGSNAINGVGITRRLDTRKLRRVQRMTGNSTTEARALLKTYNVVFSDSFSTDSIAGGTWEYTGTGNGWSISSGYLNNYADAVADGGLRTTVSYAQAQWQNSRISMDFYLYEPATTPFTTSLWLPFRLDPGANYGIFSVTGNRAYEPESVDVSDQVIGTRPNRKMMVQKNVWNHLDIYISPVSDTVSRVIMVINGVEALDISDVTMTAGASKLRIDRGQGGGYGVLIDNFVFAVATSALTEGKIDSGSTLDLTFNGDSQLDALETICDKEDWEYIVHPKAGAGNDTIDCGANVGRDLSDVLVLEEGVNIANLQRNRTSDSLATSLYTYGQASDDATTNFVCNDLSAFTTYGIIEEDYSDPRVLDVSIARTLGNYELTRRSAGNVSLSGRINDESRLIEQEPIWGYAVWGDFIWGGRKQLEAGDYVWLKSKRLNIDKKVRIVELTRHSGDAGVDLTFDYFAWRRSQELPKLQREINRLQRELMNRMNTQGPFIATLGNATGGTWYVFLRGQISKVYLDIRVAAGTGNVYCVIDGVDRTAALGLNTGERDYLLVDTTYLVTPGTHSLAFTGNAQTAKTIHVYLSTKLLG